MTTRGSERRAFRLLHVLWTQAVGTPTYRKLDWIALDNAIAANARRSRPSVDRRQKERRSA